MVFKRKLCIRRVTTTVNRTFRTFLFQESSDQKICSRIPLSFKVCNLAFRTMSQLKSLCVISYNFRIRKKNAFLVISILIPIDAVAHRQDKTTPPQKAGHSSHVPRLEKMHFAFGEYTSLRARRHSAVQCWPRVVRMPWYHQYHGQYLGTSVWTSSQSPLGASQHARKNTRERKILHVVCPLDASRQTRNRVLRRSLSLVAHKAL